MELPHLQTPWYNVKVKHTFIELDVQGDECAAKIGRRPRAFSDPGDYDPGDYDSHNDSDSCDESTKDESLDAQSTCSLTTDTKDTVDDDVVSLSSSSSPVTRCIASPRLSHSLGTAEPPRDIDAHTSSSIAPVYGVFFAPVVLLCPKPACQQGATTSAACSQAKPAGTSPDRGCSCTVSADEANSEDREKLTTITFKNVPADCTLSHVLETLDREGFSGCYDFVHAPVNFTNASSLGYVHVNLLNHVLAERVRHQFHGFRNWLGTRDDCDVPGCVVDWSDGHQGLVAFIERYRNSPLMHPSVPLEYKPAMFSNGKRVAFPAPTIRLKPPRVRHQKRGEPFASV